MATVALSMLLFFSIGVVDVTCSSSASSLSSLTSSFSHIQSHCIKRCPSQNSTDGVTNDLWCDATCREESCKNGCENWKKALDLHSSCSIPCLYNYSSNSRGASLYCLLGCESAVSMYIEDVKGLFGKIAAPRMVSVTNSSVSLSWSVNTTIRWPRDPTLSLLLQRRHDGQVGGAWHNVSVPSPPPQSSTSTASVTVQGLEAFTNYRFRLVSILAADREPLISQETRPIRTLPYGLPARPPLDFVIFAVDSSSISFSWNPPTNTNGLLLSYVLTIQEKPNGYRALKDIMVSSHTQFYTFTHLKPNTSYSLSIAARNAIGQGPVAVQNATTLQMEKSTTPKPFILIAINDKQVHRHDELFNDGVLIYESECNITGLAVNSRQNTLFVAGDDGWVKELSLSATQSSELRDSWSLKNGERVRGLSVDWLFNRLYLLIESGDYLATTWKVSRCLFGGSQLTDVITDIPLKPSQIEVDPFNGYLFWIVNEDSKRGGLYRVDLADLSNGPLSVSEESGPKIQRIFHHRHMGAFKVDYSNSRVFLINPEDETVIAISFNGLESTVIRSNVSHSQQATSMTYFDDIFYWINDGFAVAEDKNIQDQKYVQNQYWPKINDVFTGFLLYGATTQPIPLPRAPVQHLQVLFGTDTAQVHWQSPPSIPHRGRGAWQNWSYDMQINSTDGRVDVKKDIHQNEDVVLDLQPNTTYSISVASGPLLNASFTGKTLANSRTFRGIFWATNDAIQETTPLGRDVKTLADIRLFQDSSRKPVHIRSMAWMDNIMYVVTNTTKTFSIDLDTRQVTLMRNIDAVSIAVDWLGRRVYWSSANQQRIGRSLADGRETEMLSIMNGMANHLVIDSIKGKLIWCSGHSVKGSMLNGDNLQTYWSTNYFSGELAVGLTINYDLEQVFWIVQGNKGTLLYKANIDSPETSQLVSHVGPPVAKGPLQYFSDRFLWLQGESDTAFSDVNGQNLALLHLPSSRQVSYFMVMDNTHRSLRDGVNVIPNAVDRESIVVAQVSDLLNISWTPVTNVNHGKVSYEIRVHCDDESDTKVASNAWYILPPEWGTAPYTELLVSIRAFTVWSSANITDTQLRSPQSTPEAPQKPRSFVTFLQNRIDIQQLPEVAVNFRWSPPARPNGIITGYKVNCWHEKDGSVERICNDVLIHGSINEYSRTNLSFNEVYSFSVLALTVVGDGPATVPLNVSTQKETPVLLIFTSNHLWLADVDLQGTLNRSESVSSKLFFPPVAVSFISRDKQLYWIDENRDLYSHEIGGLEPRKILRLNGTGKSMVIDWVSRTLYWSELNGKSGKLADSSVYKIDLNDHGMEEKKPQKVLTNSNAVRLVEVNPFTSRLIWMEVGSDRNGRLMTSDVNGDNTLPFFDAKRCGINSLEHGINSATQVAPVTAVDWSESHRPRLIWMWSDRQEVWSSDWNGCQSTLELDSSEFKGVKMWPPSSLAVDRLHFYWSDAEGRLYKMDRVQHAITARSKTRMTSSSTLIPSSNNLIKKADVIAEPVYGVRKIATLGYSNQPLPENDCLTPLKTQYFARCWNNTSTTVTLLMPTPRRPANCTNITMATPYFQLFYGPDNSNCAKNFSLCQHYTSSDQVVVLTNLEPYTRYLIRIRITNYYTTDMYSMPVGPQVFCSTKAGAPSAPRMVNATTLTPRTIRVSWLEPSSLNGVNISYSVHWENSDTLVGRRAISKQNSGRLIFNSTEQPHFYDVHQLIPSNTYRFWVSAYSLDGVDAGSPSVPVTQTTYEEPRPPVQRNVSSTSLAFDWKTPKDGSIQSHYVEILQEDGWRSITNWTLTLPDHLYTFIIDNLNFITEYPVRFNLRYSPMETLYVWPKDSRSLSFQTLGQAPSQPNTPRALKRSNEFIELWWGPPASDGGYRVERYNLEIKKLTSLPSTNSSGSILKMEQDSTPHWKSIYTGSEHSYIVQNLSSEYKYAFRVQAINEMGASPYSDVSASFTIPADVILINNNSHHNMILSVSVSALIAFCTAMAVFLFYAYWKPQLGKKQSPSGVVPQASSVEMANLPCPSLATLRELPQRDSFVQQNNAIYGVGDGDLDGELVLLPHIRREEFVLTKFLGSGAFGEVYEGMSANLPSNTSGSNQTNSRVAVKTLRKGATEQEKGEFLKEALLMSHFKHNHILRLLGVCLDTDLNFILLELMEGGDLLSFLRNNRPSPRNVSSSPRQLSLQDLASMCVDVAKGCCYLEELHFVHRDLAARNCLVSSLDPQLRVVKIGDFGLARDIYRNDYYRKEGEGLLPVRWMAPESLVDGVFTSQTDVWSFGVLLWEILTLGQQPYPARTNLQVLHFVREGGRLDRPPNCPDSLFELMMSCWSYEPTSRPTFSQCLEELANLQDKLKHSLFTAVHNGHYVGAPIHRNSDSWKQARESGVYLEGDQLESNRALYANETVGALNGAFGLNAAQRRPSSDVRLERCTSERDSSNGLGRRSALIPRSNSIGGGSGESNSHGRYLELLSDDCRSRLPSTDDGYEMPRNVRYGLVRTFPKTNGLLPQHFLQSNSPVDCNDDNDCMSDVTDESCLEANSPTPLCGNTPVFRSSSLDVALIIPSHADF